MLFVFCSSASASFLRFRSLCRQYSSLTISTAQCAEELSRMFCSLAQSTKCITPTVRQLSSASVQWCVHRTRPQRQTPPSIRFKSFACSEKSVVERDTDKVMRRGTPPLFFACRRDNNMMLQPASPPPSAGKPAANSQALRAVTLGCALNLRLDGGQASPRGIGSRTSSVLTRYSPSHTPIYACTRIAKLAAGSV